MRAKPLRGDCRRQRRRFEGRVSGIFYVVVLAALPAFGCFSPEDERQTVSTIKQGDDVAEPATLESLSLDLGEGVSMRFILVPAGGFIMGLTTPEQGPVHAVKISRPFYMGITEVTNAQMRRSRRNFDSNDPRGGANIPFQQYIKSRNPEFNGDEQPAVYVPWEEAMAFTEWLSDRTQVSARLPSEAEWEYSCRAGTSTKYSWGEGVRHAHLYANTNDPLTAVYFRLDGGFPSDDGYRATAPVRKFRPNAFGLYDMHGNVAEWTADYWHENYLGAPDGGASWSDSLESGKRVTKGGSFECSPEGERYFSCTCAGRSWNYLSNLNFGTGFRVVVELP